MFSWICVLGVGTIRERFLLKNEAYFLGSIFAYTIIAQARSSKCRILHLCRVREISLSVSRNSNELNYYYNKTSRTNSKYNRFLENIVLLAHLISGLLLQGIFFKSLSSSSSVIDVELAFSFFFEFNVDFDSLCRIMFSFSCCSLLFCKDALIFCSTQS